MQTITVNASRNYPVVVGTNLINQLGNYISQLKIGCKVAVISDTNVWPLYGSCITQSLNANGFEVIQYIFPAGEDSKNADTYFKILSFLAENHMTRSDIAIALGGGVVGDITGFVAATYLRGITYVQIPTSLLAMVDSSVGGKTAIDLPSGKNLVGAFYQPALVLCDIDVLVTLPASVFRDGCAEVIKYGILYDEKLFAHLATHGLAFDRETVIARCVELKRNVVATDEFDTGERQKLNLGHTIGHSIEAMSNYSISHGTAVAIGTAIIARASNVDGICDTQTVKQIESILCEFGLPISVNMPAADLANYALSDKKRFGETINLILPQSIGDCVIDKVYINNLESFIEAGL